MLPEHPRARANRLPALASAVAYAGAAAFLLAAVWYALVVAEVTVASEPRRQPGQAQEAWFHTHYSWFATTLRQERYYTGAAIVGFLSLAVTGAFVRNAFGRRQPFASFGVQMMRAGGLLWVIGAVVSIGGHRAVGLMTKRGDPIETVNAITWTIDTINDAFELAGSALLGTGLLALARAGSGLRSRRRAWSRYTLAVGLVLAATAGAYAAQSFDLVDVLLIAGGAVLLPLWLAWTGRLLRGGEETAFSDQQQDVLYRRGAPASASRLRQCCGMSPEEMPLRTSRVRMLSADVGQRDVGGGPGQVLVGLEAHL